MSNINYFHLPGPPPQRHTRLCSNGKKPLTHQDVDDVCGDGDGDVEVVEVDDGIQKFL